MIETVSGTLLMLALIGLFLAVAILLIRRIR